MNNQKENKMDITQVPTHVWEEAWKIVEKRMPDYPEDDWEGIGADWDLNLWTEECEDGQLKPRATLFPVVDGETQVTCDDGDDIELAVETVMSPNELKLYWDNIDGF